MGGGWSGAEPGRRPAGAARAGEGDVRAWRRRAARAGRFKVHGRHHLARSRAQPSSLSQRGRNRGRERRGGGRPRLRSHLHCLGVDERLQRVESVGQVGQGEGHGERLGVGRRRLEGGREAGVCLRPGRAIGSTLRRARGGARGGDTATIACSDGGGLARRGASAGPRRPAVQPSPRTAAPPVARPPHPAARHAGRTHRRPGLDARAPPARPGRGGLPAGRRSPWPCAGRAPVWAHTRGPGRVRPRSPGQSFEESRRAGPGVVGGCALTCAHHGPARALKPTSQ